PGALIPRVRKARPDVVFNLFEGLPEWGDTEAFCVGMLEWLGIPYTGCPLQPVALARNKPLAKQLFRGAGLPTADSFTVEAALAVSEIEFVPPGGGDFWPIVTYDAKWKPGSSDYEATPPSYPARDLPGRLAAKLVRLAKQAFRLVGCRDYARVDFRVRPSGRPYILEVNPNPDFSPIAGLAGGLD